MRLLHKLNEKLELIYPCQWVFKVIGADQSRLRRVLAQVVDEDDATVTVSNRSSQGKYVCINLEMTVQSEAHRTGIYKALRSHPDIKMIL